MNKSLKERSLLSLRKYLKNFCVNSQFAGKFLRIFSVGTLFISLNVAANPVMPVLPQLALPTGGKVVAGNAAITQSQTPTS